MHMKSKKQKGCAGIYVQNPFHQQLQSVLYFNMKCTDHSTSKGTYHSTSMMTTAQGKDSTQDSCKSSVQLQDKMPLLVSGESAEQDGIISADLVAGRLSLDSGISVG